MLAACGGDTGVGPGVVFRAKGQALAISAADAGLRTSRQVAAALAASGCDVSGWQAEGRATMPAEAVQAKPFGGRHERAYRSVAARLNLVGDGYAVPSVFMVREEIRMRGRDVCTFPSPDQCTHQPRHHWIPKSKKRSRSHSPLPAHAGGGGAGAGRNWNCASCNFLNFDFRTECLKCASGSASRYKRQCGGGGRTYDSSEPCRDFRRGRCNRGNACRFSHS